VNRPPGRWGPLRILRAIALALAAAVLFIEEWGWRPLTAWAARVTAWPPLARLEARIRRVSPRWALLLFLGPGLLLFPIKVLALWLIHLGHDASGLAVIVATKLLGTAFVGRLFILLEPQLMQFAWFAKALNWWRETKRRVRAAVERSVAWRAVRVSMRRVRTALKRLWRTGVD
jgi:hypothetical protein